MKIGKVSESVLKRSVLKQVKTKREEVLIGTGIGEDCAFLAFSEDEVYVTEISAVTDGRQNGGAFAVIKAVNNVAASGAEPIAVLVSLLLPPACYESDLKQMMQEIEKTCAALRVQIAGGHTEVTEAVGKPVITVTGIGRAKKGRIVPTKGAKPGQDIVISKWLGLEGTTILAREHEAKLLTRYPSHLVEEAKAFDKLLSIVPEAATALRSGVCVMHDASRGGIFGALWEIAESSGVGLEIDLKKLPIRQETIEVCEFFELNPYEMLSGGCLIMVTDNGADLIKALEQEQIPAALAGKITAGNDRVVINDDERRFLEPPKSDELYKV